MSSSMRFAMMTAAGSRGRDTGIRRDFGVRTVARLTGFPTIIFPISTIDPGCLGRTNSTIRRHSFQFESKIDNCIVNNIECGYHLKKCAETKKSADQPVGWPLKGEMA